MRRLKWPVVALAVVVVLGTGGYAVAQTRDSGTSYSTAKATRGDVERTLDLSGTVTATGRRDLAFGTAGKVSSVAARAGRQVRAGQVLARLDRTPLDATVTSAVATLAKAEAELASDQAAQAATVSTAASASTSASQTSTPTSAPSRATSSATTGATAGARTSSGTRSSGSAGKPAASRSDPAVQQALAALAAQQHAVTAAQTAAGTAITAAKTALGAQAKTCSAAATTGGAGDAGETGGDGSGDGSGDTGATGALPDDCPQALAAVQDAQDTVADRQDQLQTALESLAGTLTKAVTTVQKAAQTASEAATQTPSQAPSSSSNQPTTQPGSSSQGSQARSGSAPASAGSAASGQSSGSGGGAARTVTAATLAKDQADIDTSRAQLTRAHAERRLAVLRAPYAGRVLQVDVATGDQATDSDTAVVLVGAGVTTVTATVTAAQVPSVRRGQAVTVAPAGWAESLRGTVTEIGLLPDDSSGYPVTITVPSGRAVAEGSTASVSIVTGAARDVVTVPTSAVTRLGTRAVVRVLSGQSVTRTAVTLGVVGTRRVAITKGLEVGDTVVLADLAAALPSSDSTQGNRQRFAGGTGLGPGTGGGPPTRFGGR